MNWLEEAEYNKRRLGEKDMALKKEGEIRLAIIERKLKGRLEASEKIQKRVNAIFENSSTGNLPKISGGISKYGASYSSGDIQITENISENRYILIPS